MKRRALGALGGPRKQFCPPRPAGAAGDAAIGGAARPAGAQLQRRVPSAPKPWASKLPAARATRAVDGAAAQSAPGAPEGAQGVSALRGTFSAPRSSASPAAAARAKPFIPQRPAYGMASTPKPKPDPEYYEVLYTKRSSKKHKTWNDGVLTVIGRSVTLEDADDGKLKSKANHVKGCEDMPEGSTLDVGSNEIEVVKRISAETYLSGACFAGGGMQAATGVGGPLGASAMPGAAGALGIRPKAPPVGRRMPMKPVNGVVSGGRVPARGIVPAASRPPKAKQAQPAWDPNAEGAIVLNEAEAMADTQTAVVVDPCMGKKLRPHQVAGVKFMYRAVTGFVNPQLNGCILADSMGLGKSLQTIALLYTLLKQGPQGPRSPFVRRVVLVCPSSLVVNWSNEVSKWLGQTKLVPTTIDNLSLHGGGPERVKKAIVDWAKTNQKPLLIISYEQITRHYKLVAEGAPGLLVCDEAHRIKNAAGTKTQSALAALQCKRRVLLTGTPVQNNLLELYALLDFAAPGALGPPDSFRKLYAKPIEKSRDRGASERDRQVGAARAAQLQKAISNLLLRRGPEVLRAFLPPKREVVVFVAMSTAQKDLYRTYLRTEYARSGDNALTAILHLRMMATSPLALKAALGIGDACSGPCGGGDVLLSQDDGIEVAHAAGEELAVPFAEAAAAGGMEGGKAAVLLAMLRAANERNERSVVVSNFQTVLNQVEELLRSEGMEFLRLDGSTKADTRQTLVDRFNAPTVPGARPPCAFLLSAKAGGVGLNLIGGNHLVLLDSDWNPATDHQAMGRVWRDGQKLPVTIVRMIARDSIDEKVYQRQLLKGEFRDAVGGGGSSESSTRHFAKDEIKELFKIKPPERPQPKGCETADILRKAHPESTLWHDATAAAAAAEPVLQAASDTGLVEYIMEAGVGGGLEGEQGAGAAREAEADGRVRAGRSVHSEAAGSGICVGLITEECDCFPDAEDGGALDALHEERPPVEDALTEADALRASGEDAGPHASEGVPTAHEAVADCEATDGTPPPKPRLRRLKKKVCESDSESDHELVRDVRSPALAAAHRAGGESDDGLELDSDCDE